MNLLYYASFFAIICFTSAIFLAAIRLLNGPTPQDRVLGSDTMYVNSMLLVFTLGLLFRTPWYFEIGLLISLIGFVSTVGSAKFLLRGEVIEP